MRKLGERAADVQEHAEWLASRGVSIAVCGPGDVMLFWGGYVLAFHRLTRAAAARSM